MSTKSHWLQPFSWFLAYFFFAQNFFIYNDDVCDFIASFWAQNPTYIDHFFKQNFMFFLPQNLAYIDYFRIFSDQE